MKEETQNGEATENVEDATENVEDAEVVAEPDKTGEKFRLIHPVMAYQNDDGDYVVIADDGSEHEAVEAEVFEARFERIV